MKRFFKILVSFLLSIMLLLGAATAFVIYYVDPNQFKTPLQAQVLEHTGHILHLEGPLRWKWYPMLSLEVTKLKLDNQAPFKGSLIAADTLKVELSLASLLTGRVVLDFDLGGATLVFERTVAGTENWAALQRAFSNPKPTTTTAHTLPMPSVALNSLKIQNAQVIYHDQQKDQHYMLSRLELDAHDLVKGLLQGPNPLSLSFQVDHLNKEPLGRVALKGRWSLALLSNTLQFSDLHLSFSPSTGPGIDLKGHLNIENLDAPRIQGHFESNPFKLGTVLQDLDWTHHAFFLSPLQIDATFQYHNALLTVDKLNLKNKVGLAVQGSLSADLNAKPLQQLKLEANLSGEGLKIGSLAIDAMKAQIKANKGVISIAPLDFTLEGAKQHLELGLRLDSAQPQWSLKQSGEALDLGSLLPLIDPNSPLEGKATLGMQLSAQGTQLESLERTLAGKVSLQITEGKIHHIDLSALMKQALSSIHDLVAKLSGQAGPNAPVDTTNADPTLAAQSKAWTIDPVNTSAFTPFDSLNATLIFANGIASNNDLRILHKDYRITGTGSVDIVRRQLDYKAQALLTSNPYPVTDSMGTYLFQTPLAIQIQGPVQTPSIRPDLKAYFNSTLKYLQKNKVEQIIHKTIDKALGHFLKPTQGK